MNFKLNLLALNMDDCVQMTNIRTQLKNVCFLRIYVYCIRKYKYIERDHSKEKDKEDNG